MGLVYQGNVASLRADQSTPGSIGMLYCILSINHQHLNEEFNAANFLIHRPSQSWPIFYDNSMEDFDLNSEYVGSLESARQDYQ